MLKRWLLLVCMLCLAPAALAQTATCPALAEDALSTIDGVCRLAGRNQACYGNGLISAEPFDPAAELAFDQRGDLADLAALRQLSLSPMNVDAAEWGIAVLRVQANIPNTLPGQNVTFVLIGDVTLRDESPPSLPVALSVNGNVNVRSQPSTQTANVLGSLAAGASIAATGILTDESWVRIRYGEADAVAWVFADFVVGDVAALPRVSADDALYTPMQAFFLTTGIGDNPCADVPESGLLIQTPEGAGEIVLQANGAEIRVGSTIFIQREAAFLYLYTLEGSARVIFAAKQALVPAGSSVRLPVNAEGYVTDIVEPSAPYSLLYRDVRLSPLPAARLPRPITIAAPTPPQATPSASPTGAPSPEAPASMGAWTVTVNSSGACADGSSFFVEPFSDTLVLSFSADGNLLLSGLIRTTLAPSGGGSYSGGYTLNDPDLGTSVHSLTLTFTTPTSLVGSSTGNFTDGAFVGCSVNGDYSASFNG